MIQVEGDKCSLLSNRHTRQTNQSPRHHEKQQKYDINRKHLELYDIFPNPTLVKVPENKENDFHMFDRLGILQTIEHRTKHQTCSSLVNANSRFI